jgi:hypothetical protein
MTAEKWDAFLRRQPGQTSLVVATFARASGMAGATGDREDSGRCAPTPTRSFAQRICDSRNESARPERKGRND